MPTSPLVSALCITHGRPRYLEMAVKLFQAQTWARKEMIVVDDSPPELRPRLRGPGIKYLALDARMNMGEKHNVAMRAAQGELLAYWDDDDYFGPRRFAVQADPILRGKATISGFVRDHVAQLAGPGAPYFVKFLPQHRRPRPEAWLMNGVGKYRLGMHDGTAMFSREVMRHGLVHPPFIVRQKVVFLDSLAALGEKWKDLPAADHFVYVRHKRNTWKFKEDAVLERVPRPWWFPEAVLSFWREVHL